MHEKLLWNVLNLNVFTEKIILSDDNPFYAFWDGGCKSTGTLNFKRYDIIGLKFQILKFLANLQIFFWWRNWRYLHYSSNLVILLDFLFRISNRKLTVLWYSVVFLFFHSNSEVGPSNWPQNFPSASLTNRHWYSS